MNILQTSGPMAEGWPSTETAVVEQRTSQVAQILSIVKRRKWPIVGVICAALILGVIATLLMTPKYTSVATINIQRETRNFTDVDNAKRAESSAADQEFYQTEYGLLKARSLAERVATSLHLENDERFFASFNDRKAAKWFANGQAREVASRQMRIREAGDLLLKHISIDPVRTSSLIYVSFTSPDPVTAQRVVDAWIAQFIQVSLDRRFEATSYARTYLEQRLQQLRTRIDGSQRQLVAYASQQQIVNVPSGTDSDGTPGGSRDIPLVATDLASLNAELSRATAARIVAQSRLGSGRQITSEALDNVAITTLRSRRTELNAEYAKMLQQFDPQYPAAQALRSQITALDRGIASEEARVGGSLSETYRAAAGREKQLADRVETLKSSYLDFRRRSIQYDILQRDVDTNRQLYAALLQRYKEIGVAGGVGVNNVSIVDGAELPLIPSSPKLLLNLALALLGGIVASGVVLLLLEELDSGISNPADVSDLLGVPLLGTIPKVTSDDPEGLLDDPKSSLSEAYFSLQTAMSFATDHGFPRTLMVTSSSPAEGKSTTSFALANTLARLGRRVLLIDGDMRSPSVHEVARLDNVTGLSNYLSGDDNFPALIKRMPIGSLSVMTAGPQTPSPSELLASDRLQRLITELNQQFDHVVIDSPPVMGLADAVLLGNQVEGVAFIVEAHGTSKGAARVAVGRLLNARVMVLGAVLTKFDSKRARNSGDYDYGYGYGYGKAYGEAHESRSGV